MKRCKHATRDGIWGVRLIGAGLMVVLLSMPAVADQQINQTVKARADGVVTVENIAGSIEVVGWDRNEVKVEGTLFGDVERVDIDGGKRVRIEVKYPRRAKRVEGRAELLIHVPVASRVGVECISADVDVHGVAGSIDAESISGNVDVRGKCREVEAETISGDVTVDADAAEVDVASISGRIKATGGVSDVEAESVSGGIWLEYERFLSLELESVSGDATVAGDLKAGGDFGFELHSGTLDLTVPSDVSADFRVETFSGGIDNAFGQKARKTSKYAPGRELEFSNGNGDARVRIDTFSGDVVIRKK